MKALKVSITAFSLLFVFIGIVRGQDNYGLIYNSFNVAQENRTSVQLGTEHPICLSSDAELSFELRFQPDMTTYFGYIFRMVNDNGQNIDLIYNQKDDIFNIVTGAGFTDINFQLPQQSLYDQWCTLRFHFTADTLICYINGQRMQQTAITLKDRCFRIVFGASRLRGFSTTDVPPMQMRNIKIRSNGKLNYFWPLDNVEGAEIIDSIHGEKASVINAKWAGLLHRTWQKGPEITVKGNASYCFDPLSESLLFIAEDSVYALPLMEPGTRLTRVPSNDYHLFQGNLSFYNPVDSQLYNYYIDNRGLAAFNKEDYSWDRKYDTLENTAFGHAARMFVPEQNALYIFGGYGQLFYKNLVQRIDFNNGSWTNLQTSGDFFAPRYMAGIGRAGEALYIFGGYGSLDGDQRLNPTHYYDLMRFDVRSGEFKQVYTMPVPEAPFVPAGSMVIDEKSGVFYSLVYDENKYDTKLQLIRASLSQPVFEWLADEIPYAFKDVTSDADLFYLEKSKQLVAVTALTALGSQTTFQVYTIAFPPDVGIHTVDGAGALQGGTDKWGYVLMALGLFVLGGLGWWLVKRSKRKGAADWTSGNKKASPAAQPIAAGDTTDSASGPQPDSSVQSNAGQEAVASPGAAKKLTSLSAASNSREASVSAELSEHHFIDVTEPLEDLPAGLKIFLFGTFEMNSAKGEEISQQFSPLLKELFLMILLFTIKDGKGISSDRINDIFWGNKTGKNAKNNLSVNIVRLKAILSKAGNVFIKKESGRWIADYSAADCWIDLVAFLRLKDDTELQGIKRVEKMMAFISRGAFLKQTEYRWMDEIKADVNNKVIDELLKESAILDPNRDVEYLIEIANNIFHFDPLNEDALQLKCKALSTIGRHSLAQHTYERFAREFQRIYGEPFNLTFNEIVK